jgi:glycosidase
MKRAAIAGLAAALLALCGASAVSAGGSSAGLKLHVPSPDWRDQVIYFVMTDRFDDGNPRNNDQGHGEHRPGQPGFWQGGDLAGLLRRLNYIQGLGATALWLTPPNANRAFAPSLGYAGYHGYWAEHFSQVDAHLGTLADYRRLSDALHRRGMYLVQDVVVNHTADYFFYQGGWDAQDPARFYAQNRDGHGRSAPRQWPFSLNDPRRAADRRAGIYHWTPDVSNYNDPHQERYYQMSGLDDLNTENPLVRRALRRSLGGWIRQAGVDAFRVDTAFYVPPEFYADFLHSRDRVAPGVLRVARATGRQAFHVFGEGFGIDRPGQTTAMRKIDSYMRGPKGQALLPGMLNFPLYGSLGAVFARGAPTQELAFRIEQTMALHERPHLMPNFVDNHDVDRFLAGGSTAGLRQALLAMFTLPGIPVVYYGTEQGFTQQRASMFAAGWGSGGRDHFDTGHALYQEIAALAALRRKHRVLSRGVPRMLASSASGPGALVWALEAGSQSERLDRLERLEPLVVAVNTAEHEVLVDNLALSPGQRLVALHGVLAGAPLAGIVANGAGMASFVLPPKAAVVWRAEAGPVAANSGRTSALRIDAPPRSQHSGDFMLSGQAQPGQALRLVVDGRLHDSTATVAGGQGRWQARVDTSTMIDAGAEHRAVVLGIGGEVSPPVLFTVARQWQLAADVEDPEGDDRGRSGQLVYPTDPGWGALRQADIRRVRVFTSGGAMKIEVTPRTLTRGWNPANGFDRVAFSVFIGLPEQAPGSGARAMPLQRAELPEGMVWHRRLRAHGWSNAFFTSVGASATQDGTPFSPGAALHADATLGTVTFTLPAAALGRLTSLSGAQVYVATWDYDAAWRALAREPGPYTFGGACSEGEPLVMDETTVITLP